MSSLPSSSARRVRAALGAVLATASLATASLATVSVATAVGVPSESAATRLGAPVGQWRISPLDDGTWQVTWTSPVRLPIGSDRPRIVLRGADADARIGTASLDAAGRRVTATVAGVGRPAIGDLDVVLSGDRLDATGDDLAVGAGAAARRAGRERPDFPDLDVDPGAPGSYPTTTSDYVLDPVKLPGMPQPIEMVGHVVEPAAAAPTGPRPLVLFLHGRHEFCYLPDAGDEEYPSGEWPCAAPEQEIPSHLGYDYAQRLLASQGVATVSIRVNGINAQDYRLADGGADARAAIVAAHLDHWVTLAAAHDVDLSRVVLVGHSRGGEGVARAALQIPLTAPYRIVGEVLLAPTDFSFQTSPYVPSVTVLPSCDGDVSDLQGQRFTDVGRDVLADDTALRSSVMVLGANHNFFNTEWTPGLSVAPSIDDWGGGEDGSCGSVENGRLTPQGQQDVGAAYIAGAVHLFADDDQRYLPMFDGSPVRVPSVGDATVLSAAIGGGRDVRRPRADTGLSLPQGGATSRFCQGRFSAPDARTDCDPEVSGAVAPHWYSSWEGAVTRTFADLAWSSSGQSAGLVLDRPLDLAAAGDRLELRTIVDPASGPVEFGVRLTDEAGHAEVFTPEGGSPVSVFAADQPRLWAQAVVVDPSGRAGLDLSRIVQVDVVGRSARGHVWIADLSSAPATLASVPERRAPTVSIGRARTLEGDGTPRLRTLEVPVTVEGLTRPARVRIVVVGQGRGERSVYPLDLAPGQTTATVPVTYEADRRDDYRRVTQVAAFAVDGAMPDLYAGQARVDDDDPAPPTTITVLDRRVEEGEPIRVRVAVRGRSDKSLGASLTALLSEDEGERLLQVGDLPGFYRKDTFLPDHPRWSLARAYFSLYDSLERQRTVEFEIPTRRDREVEGTEAFRFVVQVDRRSVTRTVRVDDAR